MADQLIVLLGTLSNSESQTSADVNSKIFEESMEESRIWELREINEPSSCESLRLPDNLTATKVCKLVYTNSGDGILALASNGVHKLWKWQTDEGLPMKATSSVVPQLHRPLSGILMTNETSNTNVEEVVPCFALPKNDSYLISASGGKISVFNMMTFKEMTTFLSPPPAPTFLAFHPQDNNLIAIGMEDSSIQIYNFRNHKVKTKLEGHQERVTGLAFSNALNVLVSSGAETQLCVWRTDGWEKLASTYLKIPSGRRRMTSLADTHVQFHLNQIHVLAVHETHLAIYEAPNLECLDQSVPREESGAITHATYSCDGQYIYVSFEDGSVDVLSSTLRSKCRINPTAYLSPNPSLRAYPLVIAAHPSEPSQFALGMTDGGVFILEASESGGE